MMANSALEKNNVNIYDILSIHVYDILSAVSIKYVKPEKRSILDSI